MNTKSAFRSGLFALAATAALASGAAMAQQVAPAQASDPGHPRVQEVNQRLDNQQARIQNGVADGQISAKQAGRDERQDARIAQRESADQAKHNGHLTKREQNNLNRSENHDSRRIYRQRH